MKRYPAYQDMGLPWLQEVPGHWGIVRNKFLFHEVEDRSETGEETLLSLTRDRGLIPQSEYSEREGSADSLVGYRSCRPGQLVMNRMQAWNGLFGLVIRPGLVSPDYTIFQPIQNLNLEYMLHLFKTPQMVSMFRQRSKGIGSGFFRLYTPDFGDIAVLLPPRNEQDAIVAFLDRKLTEIARFIAAKQRLIALLQEQRAAIINRAVTRGLDPDASMKPSGIEWVGDVPAHWEVVRNKVLFREVNDRSATGAETHLSMSQKLGLVPTTDIEEQTLQSESQEGFKICQVNDLVLNRLKAHLGVFARATMPGLVSPDYTVLRLKRKDQVRYFEMLFRHPAYIAEFNKAVRGIVVGFLRLYTPEFNDIYSVVPPLREQIEIINFVDSESRSIDTTISKAEREIELIKEYRTTLISDAVTGKIDVRAEVVEGVIA